MLIELICAEWIRFMMNWDTLPLQYRSVSLRFIRTYPFWACDIKLMPFNFWLFLGWILCVGFLLFENSISNRADVNWSVVHILVDCHSQINMIPIGRHIFSVSLDRFYRLNWFIKFWIVNWMFMCDGISL